MRTHHVVASAVVAVALAAGTAAAEPVACQKAIASQMLKLSKTALKAYAKSCDGANIGKITAPCPDPIARAKIDTLRAKVVAKIGTVCQAGDIATLGIPATCAYEATPTGVESACAALPAGTPAEVAACLACWKEAEVYEYIATLYASHAVEVCDGALDETSTRCSELDCTTPLPDQQDLGDTGENDCQKAIGKAGVKYLVTVLKSIEKCALAGGNEASCDLDLKLQTTLDKAKVKLEVLVENKCGNRNPVPAPPFCCRTMGNQCVAAATRQDCIDLGHDVMNGKTCGGGGTCDNVPGNEITWWGTCPISDTCPGTPLASREDMVECVHEVADEIVDEMLCLQFPTGGWSCPSDAP